MVESDSRTRFTPRVALAAIYVCGVVVYLLLGSRQVIPSISPDEFTYGHLARSIADGDGLTWRGENVPLRSALYLYAIAPAWLVGSSASAYGVAKAEGAFLLCLVVVPTWLLARHAVGERLALLPAALSIAGTWMLAAAGILTENLAYPLATAALAATVMALRRPGSRWLWAALGLTALATLSRAQLAVLFSVLPVAGLLDVVRCGRADAGARLAERRLLLLVSGGILLVGVSVLIASPASVLGSYAGLQDYAPSISDVLVSAGRHVVGLIAVAGVAPVLLLLAVSCGRPGWRDQQLGPLLCVFWVAAAALIVQVAWYMAGGHRTWHIERYVAYVVPLALTILVVAAVRVRPDWRVLGVVSGVTALVLLLAAPIRNVSEEEGVFGLFRPLHAVVGGSAGIALALVALLSGGIASALIAKRPAHLPATLALSFAALTGAIFVLQDAAAWSWRISAVSDVREDLPKDLRWLDHAARGPVARIVVADNPASSAWTDFFNKRLTQVYVPAPALGALNGPVIHGRTCSWNAAGNGALTFASGCGPLPTFFLLDDEVAKLTLAGQRLVRSEASGARLVELPAGTSPKLLSLINLPCGPVQHRIVIGTDHVPRKAGRTAICTPSMSGTLWLGQPGRLELQFLGGTSDQQIVAAGKTTLLPAGQPTVVRIAAPRGPTAFEFQLSWTGAGPVNPRLDRFDLVQGTTRTDLMGR